MRLNALLVMLEVILHYKDKQVASWPIKDTTHHLDLSKLNALWELLAMMSVIQSVKIVLLDILLIKKDQLLAKLLLLVIMLMLMVLKKLSVQEEASQTKPPLLHVPIALQDLMHLLRIPPAVFLLRQDIMPIVVDSLK